MISIVIPTYNRKNKLKTCIESIINQETTEKVEIFVCDSNSSDGTEILILDLKHLLIGTNFDIKYMKSDVIMGPGENRNRGAEKAANEIIGFIDDDCYFKEKIALKEIYNKFKNDKIDILRFRVEVYDKKEITFFTHQPGVNDFAENDYGGIFFIRKNIFEKIGGFEETFFNKNTKIHFKEDTDFFYRAFDKGIKDCYIKKAYVVHPVYKGSYKKPFQELKRTLYQPLFANKWEKYLKRKVLDMRNVRFILSIFQVFFFILSFKSIETLKFYMIFHLLHFLTYAYYVRKFKVLEILLINIQLFILQFYTIYIYIKSIKLLKNSLKISRVGEINENSY